MKIQTKLQYVAAICVKLAEKLSTSRLRGLSRRKSNSEVFGCFAMIRLVPDKVVRKTVDQIP